MCWVARGATTRGVTQELQGLADPALSQLVMAQRTRAAAVTWSPDWPAEARAVSASRSAPGVGRSTGQRLKPRDDRLADQFAGKVRLGEDDAGLGDGVLRLAAGAQDRGTGRTAAGPPGSAAAACPRRRARSGGLLQPTRRGEGFGRSDQAGQRVLIGGRREFQRPHGQVGRCLRRLMQGSGRRPVQSGQRRGIARVRGLEQMPGGQCRRCATAQQDLPVLAVQRLAGRPRAALEAAGWTVHTPAALPARPRTGLSRCALADAIAAPRAAACD